MVKIQPSSQSSIANLCLGDKFVVERSFFALSQKFKGQVNGDFVFLVQEFHASSRFLFTNYETFEGEIC